MKKLENVYIAYRNEETGKQELRRIVEEKITNFDFSFHVNSEPIKANIILELLSNIIGNSNLSYDTANEESLDDDGKQENGDGRNDHLDDRKGTKPLVDNHDMLPKVYLPMHLFNAPETEDSTDGNEDHVTKSKSSGTGNTSMQTSNSAYYEKDYSQTTSLDHTVKNNQNGSISKKKHAQIQSPTGKKAKLSKNASKVKESNSKTKEKPKKNLKTIPIKNKIPPVKTGTRPGKKGKNGVKAQNSTGTEIFKTIETIEGLCNSYSNSYDENTRKQPSNMDIKHKIDENAMESPAKRSFYATNNNKYEKTGQLPFKHGLDNSSVSNRNQIEDRLNFRTDRNVFDSTTEEIIIKRNNNASAANTDLNAWISEETDDDTYTLNRDMNVVRNTNVVDHKGSNSFEIQKPSLVSNKIQQTMHNSNVDFNNTNKVVKNCSSKIEKLSSAQSNAILRGMESGVNSNDNINDYRVNAPLLESERNRGNNSTKTAENNKADFSSESESDIDSSDWEDTEDKPKQTTNIQFNKTNTSNDPITNPVEDMLKNGDLTYTTDDDSSEEELSDNKTGHTLNSNTNNQASNLDKEDKNNKNVDIMGQSAISFNSEMNIDEKTLTFQPSPQLSTTYDSRTIDNIVTKEKTPMPLKKITGSGENHGNQNIEKDVRPIRKPGKQKKISKIHNYSYNPYTISGKVTSKTAQTLEEAEGEHKCGECGNMFNKMASLMAHMSRSHNPSKQFKCPECPKTFTSGNAIRKHSLSHRPKSEWPIKCPFCDKRFQAKADLPKHLFTTIHSGDPRIPQPGTDEWMNLLNSCVQIVPKSKTACNSSEANHETPKKTLDLQGYAKNEKQFKPMDENSSGDEETVSKPSPKRTKRAKKEQIVGKSGKFKMSANKNTIQGFNAKLEQSDFNQIEKNKTLANERNEWASNGEPDNSYSYDDENGRTESNSRSNDNDSQKLKNVPMLKRGLSDGLGITEGYESREQVNINFVKPPVSAFFWFKEERGNEVKDDLGDAYINGNDNELDKFLGDIWMNMSPIDRERYEILAENDRIRYDNEKKKLEFKKNNGPFDTKYLIPKSNGKEKNNASIAKKINKSDKGNYNNKINQKSVLNQLSNIDIDQKKLPKSGSFPGKKKFVAYRKISNKEEPGMKISE